LLCSDQVKMPFNMLPLFICLSLFKLCWSQGSLIKINATGAYVSQHNLVRGNMNSGNMECTLEYDNAMASEAEKLAVTCVCNQGPPTGQYGIAYSYFPTPGPLPNAESVANTLFDEGALNYDYNTNTCAAGTTCDNYKQFTWYQADKLGCAIANCPTVNGLCAGMNTGASGYMAVCAYTYNKNGHACAFPFRALLSQVPYVMGLNGQPCTFCAAHDIVCSQNLCCTKFYLECPVEIGTVIGAPGCGAQPVQADMALLHRYFNNAIRSNYLAVNQSVLNTLNSDPSVGNLGVIGAVAIRNDGSTCPYLQRIHHIYNPAYLMDIYLINELVYKQRLSEGYWDKGVIGYAVPGPYLCGATIPIYEFYSAAFLCTVQLQNSSDVIGLFKNTIPGSYTFQDTLVNLNDEALFINTHNSLRASLLGGNMECTLEYDDDMEKWSAKEALKCSCNENPPTGPYGVAYSYTPSPGKAPTAEDIANSFFEEGAINYNYASNTCEPGATCDNFKQFSWYQANKIGCSLAKCQAVNGPCAGMNAGAPGYLGVCAYSHKALLNQVPYVVGMNNQPCTYCASTEVICSQNLCCTREIGVFNEQTKDDMVKLVRFFDNNKRTNLLVTDVNEMQRLRRLPEVTDLGTIGSLAKEKTNSCPYLKPVHHLFSNKLQMDVYLTNTEVYKERLRDGFENKGIIGYALAGPEACQVSVAIYTFFSQALGTTVQLQNGTDVLQLLRDQIPGSFLYQGVEFYSSNFKHCASISVSVMARTFTSLISFCFFAYCSAQGMLVRINETGSLIAQHNILRAQLEGGNMQCTLQYDYSMVKNSEREAMKCSCNTGQLYSMYGIAYYYSAIPGPLPSAADIVGGFYDDGSLNYDYALNTCASGETCDNFKQFAWYQANALGCAMARCQAVTGPCAGANSGSAGYLAVCSYTYKALTDEVPFVVGPRNRPCSYCASNEKFCSPVEIGSIYSPFGGGMQPPISDMVLLYRFFNNAIRSNLLVTDPLVIQQYRSIPAMGNLGPIGAVVRRYITSCPTLRPIHHIYSPTHMMDFYTINEEVYQQRLRQGYQNRGIIGYAVPGPRQCGSSLAIFDFYSAAYSVVVQLQNSTDVERLFRGQIPGGYVVALLSGGKDSCFNLMKCVQNGHQATCVANLRPPDGIDDLESYMFQTVGHEGISTIAEALELPLISRTIHGSSSNCEIEYFDTTNDEVEDMKQLLLEAKKLYNVEAVSSGAIASNYQKNRIDYICERIDLESLTYLWQRDQVALLNDMMEQQLDAVIVKTASMGLLPNVYLGKTVRESFEKFLQLKNDYGFNVCGEGGEYETMVVHCPLFKRRIVIEHVERVINESNCIAPVGYLKIHRMRLQE
ncbi:Diphthine--ammonia ligase, partial [Trichinella murrelli]